MALSSYKKIIEKDCLVVSFPCISKKFPSCFWAQKSDILNKNGSHQYVDQQIFVPYFNNPQTTFIPFLHKQASVTAQHFVKEQIQQCPNISTKLKQQMKRNSILIIDDHMNRTFLSTENKTFYWVCDVFFLIQSTDLTAYRPNPVNLIILRGPIWSSKPHSIDTLHSTYALTLHTLCSPTLDMQATNALHHYSVIVNHSILCLLIGHSWVALQIICHDRVTESKHFENHIIPDLYVLQTNTTILFVPYLNASTLSSISNQYLYDFENVCKFLDMCKEDVKKRNDNNTHLTRGVDIYKNMFGVYNKIQPNFFKTLAQHSQNTDQYYIYEIKFNAQYLFLQWYHLWTIQNILLPDSKNNDIYHTHRLGGVKPHNLNSILLWEYCRLRIRLTIDLLLSLETKPNECHGVVLILTDLENIASNEWQNIQIILESFSNELKDMTYPKHHVFCALICLWDPEYRSNILPSIQEFFLNQHSDTQSNDFESICLKNKKHLIQKLIQEYQLLCTENFPKSLLNMLEANQLTLSKAQRILHCWTLFHSTSPVVKLTINIKQFPELLIIENTAETISHQNLSQKDANQAIKNVFDEKAQKIINDLDFYIFLPIQNPKLFHSPPMHYDPRALLCGASGTGKKRILNYLTKKYPQVHVNVEHLTSLYSPYFGETERRLQNEIKQMRLPGVFVLEGLELLSVQNYQGEQDSTYSTFHRRILVTLLLCLDGFHDTVSKRAGQLGFIGVSKLPPEYLDSSLTRPGRLERWFLL